MLAPSILTTPGPRRRFLVGLGAICLVALAWRVGYVFLSHPPSDQNLIDEGDAFYYAVQTDQLANGNGFYSPFDGTLAADHPPLTIVVLAPVALAFGHNIVAKRLAMAVLGTVVVALVGLLARRFGVRHDGAGSARLADRVGWAAAIVATVNPNLWMNDALIMSETLAALLYLVVFLVAYRIVDRRVRLTAPGAEQPPDAPAGPPAWREWAPLGAAIGLCALARAEALLLLPLLVLPLAWWCRRRDPAVGLGALTGHLALAGVAAVAVIAPWSAYISIKYDKLVTLSTNDGLTLWGANCPDTYFGSNVGSWSITCVYDALEPGGEPSDDPALAGNEAEQASGLRDKGLAYARDHAHRWPAVLLARQGRTWAVFEPGQAAFSARGEGRPSWASWAGTVTLWAMVPLAIGGAVLARGRPVWPLATSIVLVIITSTFFYGIARFRLPADLALTVLTGVLLATLVDRRLGDAGRPRRGVPA